MFVSVSWVSFLIPAEQIPGRVGLLINLFLVATNIFNTIIDVSPNTEGMTAISAWMIAYMCFVFLEMMEYAVLLYFMMANKAIKIKKKRNELLVIHDDDCFLLLLFNKLLETIAKKLWLQRKFHSLIIILTIRGENRGHSSPVDPITRAENFDRSA